MLHIRSEKFYPGLKEAWRRGERGDNAGRHVEAGGLLSEEEEAGYALKAAESLLLPEFCGSQL